VLARKLAIALHALAGMRPSVSSPITAISLILDLDQSSLTRCAVVGDKSAEELMTRSDTPFTASEYERMVKERESIAGASRPAKFKPRHYQALIRLADRHGVVERGQVLLDRRFPGSREIL